MVPPLFAAFAASPGSKTPRAVTGAPVAAYSSVQRYRSERNSVAASALPYTCRQLSAPEERDVLGFIIALGFTQYSTNITR